VLLSDAQGAHNMGLSGPKYQSVQAEIHSSGLDLFIRDDRFVSKKTVMLKQQSVCHTRAKP
jgi:hypothetical protein